MMSTTGALLTCFKISAYTLSPDHTEVTQTKENKDRFCKPDFWKKNNNKINQNCPTIHPRMLSISEKLKITLV